MLLGASIGMATYNSPFQSLLVNQYLKSLSRKLETTITVESVSISIFNNVTINKIYIEDLDKDTLLYADKINVDVKVFSLNDQKIILDEVKLDNAFFNLKASEKETNLAFIIDYFASNDTTDSDWEFAVNEVVLNQSRFDFNNETVAPIPKGLDFNHLSLTDINADISDIELFIGVECKINHLSLKDKSGFILNDFIADTKVSDQGIFTEGLVINTPNSHIEGLIGFGTEKYADLADFFEAVKINALFQETKLDFNDLAYFVPFMDGLHKTVNLDGYLRGRMNNLMGRKLKVLFDDGTRFAGNVDLSGLPNPDEMYWYVDVKELTTNKQRVETFPLLPFTDSNYVQLPSNFIHLGPIRFSGNFTGFHHDFVAYGDLNTSIGNVKTDVAVKIKDGEPYYKGKIISNNFNLGKLLEIPKELGEVTMNIDVDGKGFTKETLDSDFKGEINQIIIKNYQYNNIAVNGHFKNQTFSGYLALKDKNIEFDFDGSANFSGKIPEFHFISNIKDAKLAKLNLIDSEGKLKTRFSTQLAVNFTGNHIDNFVGDIKFLNSVYEDLLDTIIVDSALVESRIDGKIRRINITSDIVDAELKGDFSFEEIAKFTNNFFVRYIPSQIDKTHNITNLSQDLDFMIHLHNSNLLSKLYARELDLSDHTIFEGNYNAKTHLLSIDGKSPFINAYGIKMDNFSVKTRTNENVFDFDLFVDKVYQNDSLYLDNFTIESVLQYDSAETKLKWNNKMDSVKNMAEIKFLTVFDGYNSIKGSFRDSYAYFSDSLWTIKSNNQILKDTSQLLIRSLAISSGNQQILVDGKLSNDPTDQIDILMKKFDLNTVNKLIPGNSIELNGIIDGVASVTKYEGELMYTSDLEFDKLRFNKSLIGNGALKALWNTASKSLKIDGKFYRDHIPTILFSGNYYPNNEEESLNMNFKLHQTELSVLGEYLKDDISNLKGMINADIKLTGNFKNPLLNGNVTLQNTSFKVNYLNTTYVTQYCKIDVVPDMISFDNVEISDLKNNKAYANGTIYHESFKDFSIDVGLDVHNLMVLNTTELDNSLYNGKAFVSGFVSVGSYEKHMLIDADIKTEKNTIINIPLDDNQDIEESNFIEFVSHDSSEINLNLKKDVDLTNLELNFDMEVTPDAQVRLVFDDKIGDVMRSTGSGNINLNINNDGDLNMFGDYVVKDGDYLFTLQNVINKRFDLEEGGTIKWNGSPYEAEINLTAVYRLRARLYDLLVGVDTSDIYKKRIPVDLKLKMQNEMMNPDISFDIFLPTADEDTKNKVRSVLYVSDKEENIQELNKQVFSLLVLNSFLSPTGSDAGYGHASVGSTTSSELLSNQLSNWLSKISNDFDIGVNYRPGDELSGQELELALSTQLFNDRVVVDGNFGVSENQNVSSTTDNTNNLIGDISVEYKITKDGKLRAKAFNNSNQFSFQNNNSAYTQGLGLSYKEEYDTGKEFWEKFLGRFRRKKKKED